LVKLTMYTPRHARPKGPFCVFAPVLGKEPVERTPARLQAA
jgi:hypothetical protein